MRIQSDHPYSALSALHPLQGRDGLLPMIGQEIDEASKWTHYYCKY